MIDFFHLFFATLYVNAWAEKLYQFKEKTREINILRSQKYKFRIDFYKNHFEKRLHIDDYKSYLKLKNIQLTVVNFVNSLKAYFLL